VYYGSEKLPAGPNIDKSDAIIIVEGRNDVFNLMKHGIKNVIAVEGTSIPQVIIDLCNEKVSTAFVDGDRGGELVLRELLQVADVDFVARAPQTREVEELPYKLVMKALKNKVPAAQFIETMGLKIEKPEKSQKKEKIEKSEKVEKKLDGEMQQFKDILDEGKSSHNAVFLNDKNKEIKRIKTDKMIEALPRDTPSIIVFDGIVTQRLVDAAYENGVKKIVATTMGEVTKIPKSLKIITSKQLE
jgi:DNA primase